MIPIIALVGQPNVGKSTLFNRLTKRKDAVVADMPGVTRDRQYGDAAYEDHSLMIVDTGGIVGGETGIAAEAIDQVQVALAEADVVVFVVDARAGLTPGDSGIADQLRQLHKPVVVAVNKTDGLDTDVVCGEFYGLGFDLVMPIAAAHNRGTMSLLGACVETGLADFDWAEEVEGREDRTKVAVMGRPNVGKSTLVNRLFGDNRVIVYDAPGTTRDSIFVDLDYRGRSYTLIDTAGMRRRGRVSPGVERFSVTQSLRAADAADVVILVVDAQEGVTDQDLHILEFVLSRGCAVVIALNKWDGLTADQKERVWDTVDRRLSFVKSYIKIWTISALHGTGVGELLSHVDDAYASAKVPLSTSKINRVLAMAVQAHQPPPAKNGRRIKLKYAHVAGDSPPTIVIHGAQANRTPEDYKRYLANYFREAFDIKGTPVKLIFKTSDNPYA